MNPPTPLHPLSPATYAHYLGSRCRIDGFEGEYNPYRRDNNVGDHTWLGHEMLYAVLRNKVNVTLVLRPLHNMTDEHIEVVGRLCDVHPEKTMRDENTVIVQGSFGRALEFCKGWVAVWQWSQKQPTNPAVSDFLRENGYDCGGFSTNGVWHPSLLTSLHAIEEGGGQ